MPAFSRAEFEHRVERARTLMTRHKIDGMLVCSEVNLEYLAGFRTQFAWNTPTRPWYFVLPRVGEATAVIPDHGASSWLVSSWCRTLLTWPSPRPENEGLDLLTGAIGSMQRRYGRFGVELGPESRLGMPVGDLLRLGEMIRPVEMVDCIGVMRALRLVKSAAEVRRIRFICRTACDAFDALPGLIGPRDSERDVMRAFQFEAMKRGVDKTPYVMPRSGPGIPYESALAGPTNRRLRQGDVVFLDQGCKHEGYFCDFNRNFAIGEPGDAVKRANALLYRAMTAGIRAARPGNTAEDVYRAQAKVLEEGATASNIGRLGHGLGKNLTEPPSNMPGDRTPLVPGMVLTIEPSLAVGANRMLIREENLVVTESGCRLLSRREPLEMPVIAA